VEPHAKSLSREQPVSEENASQVLLPPLGELWGQLRKANGRSDEGPLLKHGGARTREWSWGFYFLGARVILIFKKRAWVRFRGIPVYKTISSNGVLIERGYVSAKKEVLVGKVEGWNGRVEAP